MIFNMNFSKDTNIDFDVETCSEKYKEYIRDAEYGDTVSRTTKENMIFIYENKKYTVRFNLEFSFDFENGFTYANFSDFKPSRITKPVLMDEFVKYIKVNFVSTDRLSR